MIDATVVIAAYRAADTLPRAVASALGQEGVTVEVVIGVDACPEDTSEVAAALAADDPRVKVADLTLNGGPSAARNAALALATGRWIAVLDSDDDMAPGRLRAMIDAADAGEADLVCDNLLLLDEEAGPDDGAGELFLGEDAPEVWDLETYVEENAPVPEARNLGFLKPLIRRDFLEANAIRYDPGLRNGEDFHLVLACIAAGAAALYLPQPGYRYRRRAGSISNRLDLSHVAPLLDADDRFIASRNGLASQRLIAAFMARRRALTRMVATEKAMRALKNRAPMAALGALAREPAAIGLFLLQLWRAAAKRI